MIKTLKAVLRKIRNIDGVMVVLILIKELIK